MPDYIVNLNFSFSAVTDCRAKNEKEALNKIMNQVNKDKLLKALSTIEINTGAGVKTTFNDLIDLEITEDYVEED